MNERGNFELLSAGAKLISSTIDGFFSMNESENFWITTYNASIFSRFAVPIAVFSGGQWRLRFRAITSPKHGLLLFKLKKTVALKDNNLTPQLNDKKNTAAIFGVKPRKTHFKIDFRVFANDRNGGQNNGYVGSATWKTEDGFSDVHSVDDVLDGKTPKKVRQFHHELYDNFSLLSLREQVFDFDECY